MKQWLVLFFILSLLGSKVIAQETDTTKEKNVKIFPLPIVFFTPETDWAGGAVSLVTFRFKDEPESSRGSQFQFGGAYTQRDQLLLYLPFQLYKNNEKFYAFGELGYYKYSYRFFGVGSDLPDENEELYSVDFPRIRLNFTQLVRPKWYVGVRYWYDGYDIVQVEEEGLLDRGEITGENGGNVSSLGFISLYDSRNNYNYPTSGTYLEVLALPNYKITGSDFEFTRYSIDYVTYLSKQKNVLALNLYGASTVGDPPFNELGLIGGLRRMRGFFEGRFRDRNIALAQVEYRRELFWKFGMVAFAGIGTVASTISDYSLSNVKRSGGVGIRFRLDDNEKINVRCDFGYGQDGNSGVYLTIGEAF